ncbi:MAG: hypothetical protein ACXACY_19750 [Candidatus Hodarchaeales archaeon]|jgi:hypothetical protein
MKKALKIIGIILIVLWFGGNLGLYVFHKYIDSKLNAYGKDYLNSTPEKLTLQEADMNAESLYLVGFKLKLPFYKEDIKNVSLIFVGHELRNVSIFLKNKAYISFNEDYEVTEEIKEELRDRLKDSGQDITDEKESSIDRIIRNIFEIDGTFFDITKAIEYSRLKDFSWWNLYHNVRLSTRLTLKSMYTNKFKVKSYDLETPYLQGILRNIEISNRAISTSLYWDWDRKSYSFEILDVDRAIDSDVRNIISTIQKESNIEKSFKAMERVYKNKKETKYPEELILLSMISLKGATSENLKELLKINRDKDYQLLDFAIDGIKREIDYLESQGN